MQVYRNRVALVALVALSAFALALNAYESGIDIGVIALAIHAWGNTISIAHIEFVIAAIQLWLAIHDARSHEDSARHLPRCECAEQPKKKKPGKGKKKK